MTLRVCKLPCAMLSNLSKMVMLHPLDAVIVGKEGIRNSLHTRTTCSFIYCLKSMAL